MVFDQYFASIIQKVFQRFVAITGQFNFIFLSPHYNADQCNENVQRNVKLNKSKKWAQA